MSKRYSLFNGAGAASLRRLGVLLAMLLTAAWYSVAYADAGFYTAEAWNIALNLGDDRPDNWVGGDRGAANSSNVSSNLIGEAIGIGINDGDVLKLETLGEIDRLHLNRVAVRTWENSDNDDVNNVTVYYKVDNGNEYNYRLTYRTTIDNNSNNKLWSDDISANSETNRNLIEGLAPGEHTLYIRFRLGTSFGYDRWMPTTGTETEQQTEGNWRWCAIPFTIPHRASRS